MKCNQENQCLDQKGSHSLRKAYHSRGIWRAVSMLLVAAILLAGLPVSRSQAVKSKLSGYDAVYSFSDGMARVMKNYKYGFIDTTGKLIAKVKYDAAEDFSEGLAVVETNGKYGYLDKKGKVVIKASYSWALSFSDGLAVIQKDGKYGYINKKGKVVIKPTYDEAGSFSDGAAVVKKGNSYRIINKNGKVVAKNLKYDYIQDFSEGLALVSKNDKYGFINTKGKVVIKLTYAYAESFSDGLAMVASKQDDDGFNDVGFIDKTGKEVIKQKYEQYVGTPNHFGNGVIALKRAGTTEWVLLNKKGKETDLKIGYVYLENFSEGLAVASKAIGIPKYAVVDTKGNEIVSEEEGYEYVLPCSEGLIVAMKKDVYYVLDKTGKVVLR